jgi:ADP-L-glycero-D-manno-heptose 6-epimerase
MVIQLGHQILDGKKPRLFEGSDKIFRDFINIEDILQANIRACETKKNGTYNIGTGNPRSFKDIADILQKELGTRLNIEYIPNPYTNYQFHTQADISDSITNLGFDPKITLEDGIKDYIPEIINMHGADIQ